jgi:hypothetical protein
MKLRASKPTVHPARFTRPALLGRIYLGGSINKVFALGNRQGKEKAAQGILAYLRESISDMLKVLITAAMILLECHILILGHSVFLGDDIGNTAIKVLVAYSCLLSVIRCVLNINNGLLGRHLAKLLHIRTDE